jgi:hypothetical protein
MIRARWTIPIAKPASAVFDFVADLRNEPRFNPDASNIIQTTPGPIGLGTVFEEDFKGMGHYVTTIDRFDRPSALWFDARNPRTDARVRFLFHPTGDASCEVSCEIDLTMKGFMRVLEPLLSRMIRRQIEQSRGPMVKATLGG